MTILAFLKISLLIFSVLTSKDIYTVQEAQQCFHSKALQTCQNVINECLTRQNCERQLHFFHDCNFQKQYENQIFNGNCFKNWNLTAIESKNVIQCLDHQCNLANYNSQISLPVLYTCSSEALINEPIECNQKCQQILSEKISQKITYQPIQQIYSQDGLFESQISQQNVIKIIKLIRKECIEQNAPIRKKHQNDLLNKKINKQKMIDRMNKRTETDPFLNQNIQNTQEKNKENSEL